LQHTLPGVGGGGYFVQSLFAKFKKIHNLRIFSFFFQKKLDNFSKQHKCQITLLEKKWPHYHKATKLPLIF
jgi:hypothetical protein